MPLRLAGIFASNCVSLAEWPVRKSGRRCVGGAPGPSSTGSGGGGLGEGVHRLDLGGGEAADDDRVEGRVGGERLLGRVGVGGGDADGALGLAEAGEVVAVAVVEVAVEGLLLGEALGGVGADARCGRSRRPAASRARRPCAPASTCCRAPAAKSGVIQLKKAPSNSAPARAHIFGPIAARTRRTPGSVSRSSGRDSRIRVSGFSEKPAPTPSQSRAGSRPRRSMSAAIVSGGVRSSAITATPRSISGAAAANSASVSSPCAPGMVVGPDRGVAELRAARGERPRHLGVEPGGDSEAPHGPGAAFSKSATHSMCGVWGNMSTGLTRRSL